MAVRNGAHEFPQCNNARLDATAEDAYTILV